VQESLQCHTRLAYLRNRWSEIQPTESLKSQAQLLLRLHKLRAADALQLAAALAWCKNNPREHAFIAADEALLEAAAIEGFLAVPLH
jgi:hypothetical protein